MMIIQTSFKCSLLCLCVVVFNDASAQVKPDTLQQAQELVARSRFSDADQLLSVYNKRNHDQYAVQLHARVLYWLDEPERSVNVYERGIKTFPEYYPLQYDYANMLAEFGRFTQARDILQRLLHADAANKDGLLLMAKLYYWEGNIKAARDQLRALQLVGVQNPAASAFIEEFNRVTSPAASLLYDFASDDQPLDVHSIALRYAQYSSGVFSPSIDISYAGNNTGGQDNYQVMAANLFRFNYGKTTVSVKVGLAKPTDTTAMPLAGMGITQRLTANFSATISASKRLYQYTLASTRWPFSYTQLEAGVVFDKQQRWNGKLGIRLDLFKDNNQVTSCYGWVAAPVVVNNTFSLQAGGAVQFADSRENRFKPKNDHTSQDLYTELPGVYDPYFTPHQQWVASGLVVMKLNPVKYLTISGKASVAGYASIQNTVLILEQNAVNQLVVNRYYYRHRYTPVEADISILLQLSPAIELNTGYSYSSLFFYKKHAALVQLTYRFIRGQ